LKNDIVEENRTVPERTYKSKLKPSGWHPRAFLSAMDPSNS
jgi:hypothetical protein